ncbi:hypothetical protein [Cellulophaga sp. RHA19]|nr:hypothetical protein [Cellulophaga sp. RHA19]
MKNTIKISVLLILFSMATGFSQDTNNFFTKANAFFNTNVMNGKVAYKSIKESPKELNNLVEQMKTIKVAKSDVATYQAFWINAYNISVIKNVVENYPLKSPLDKTGFFDKIKHTVAG